MSKVIGEIKAADVFGEKLQVIRTGKENPKYPLSVKTATGICIPLLSAKGQDLILSHARMFAPDERAETPAAPVKTHETPAAPAEHRMYKPARASEAETPQHDKDEWGF